MLDIIKHSSIAPYYHCWVIEDKLLFNCTDRAGWRHKYMSGQVSLFLPNDICKKCRQRFRDCTVERWIKRL